MTDPEALLAVIELEKPHFVVPEIEAIATDALALVEERGGAVVIPTARATQLTMNREGIRRLAAEELGLPTSPYASRTRLPKYRQRQTESVFRASSSQSCPRRGRDSRRFDPPKISTPHGITRWPEVV